MVDNAPKGKKERVSLIAAVTNKGLEPAHCLIHNESVNKSAFLTYLAEVLLPDLEAGSVLVMDNWTVHHGHDVGELVEAHGCTIFYLPSYSPDFNPIEFLFSKIKSLRKETQTPQHARPAPGIQRRRSHPYF